MKKEIYANPSVISEMNLTNLIIPVTTLNSLMLMAPMTSAAAIDGIAAIGMGQMLGDNDYYQRSAQKVLQKSL